MIYPIKAISITICLKKLSKLKNIFYSFVLFFIIFISTPASANVQIYTRCMQQGLNILGFNAGVVDGIWGRSTESAISAYQRSDAIISEIIKNAANDKNIAEILCETLLNDYDAIQRSAEMEMIFENQEGPISNYLAEGFSNADERQLLSILNLHRGSYGQTFHFTRYDYDYIIQQNFPSVQAQIPITLNNLEYFEQSISSLSYWPSIRTNVISTSDYTIDEKAMAVDGGICGGGGYQIREIDGIETITGNEGIISHLSPIGDIDNDGNDDLLVGFVRGQWRGLSGETVGRHLSQPTVITWQNGDLVVDENYTRSMQDTILPRHVEYADFNNDGFLDIYIADAGYDGEPECGFENALYANRNGYFERVFAVPRRNDYSHALTVEDFDSDGDIDIAVINSPHTKGVEFDLCLDVFGVESNQSSYFLENKGDFIFELHEISLSERSLYYSAEGYRSNFSYLALGAAGSDWQEESAPSVEIYRVNSDFSISLDRIIDAPLGFPSNLFAAEIEFADINNNGLDELFVSWQFSTEPVNNLDYLSPNGKVFGGRYIQVIANPFGSNSREITHETFGDPPLLNIRGEGAWCVEMYFDDFDSNGSMDFACSSYDQWKRIGGRITPQRNEIPVLYLNSEMGLRGYYLDRVLDSNKWLVPLNTQFGKIFASLEPFTCNEAVVTAFALDES